jgi:hypothetical protein
MLLLLTTPIHCVLAAYSQNLLNFDLANLTHRSRVWSSPEILWVSDLQKCHGYYGTWINWIELKIPAYIWPSSPHSVGLIKYTSTSQATSRSGHRERVRWEGYPAATFRLVLISVSSRPSCFIKKNAANFPRSGLFWAIVPYLECLTKELRASILLWISAMKRAGTQ